MAFDSSEEPKQLHTYPKDLFQGTAHYYSQYRVPYPEDLLADLRKRANITGTGKLLDFACGTGEIAIPMHPFFKEVWAVDQEAEMIALGTEKAQLCNATNITWMVDKAESLKAPASSFELITIGAAFHWMDREAVAESCRELLIEGQPLAIMGSNSPWTGTADWQVLAQQVIKKWMGEKRRAGSGKFLRPKKSHEVVLADIGFDVEEFKFPLHYVWTLDSFMGYLYSTSFASINVLEDKAEGFESDMRKTLLQYEPSGQFSEVMDFYYILAYEK